MNENLSFPKISQLSLSDSLGHFKGDYQCGPLSFYAYLRALSPARQRPGSYPKFLKNYFPGLKKTSPFNFEYGLSHLMSSYPELLSQVRVYSLRRERDQQDLCGFAQKLLAKALQKHHLGILQIGAHHATLKNSTNYWERGLGHFMVLLSVQPQLRKRVNFFKVEYWDPWDAKIHEGILYEELYRDFQSCEFKETSRKDSLRLSPSGHQVRSPHLCLLAPSLDLYDPKVYFSQRYIYALERALI